MMKYSIGDYVIVLHVMQRHDSHGIKWVPRKLGQSQLGQITGLARRHDGDVKGGGYCTYPEDYEPRYFVSTGNHLFWQVKFGLLNQSVLVHDEDMRLANINEVEDLPKLYTRSYWDDKSRKALSDDSKHWDRDAKGRWIS